MSLSVFFPSCLMHTAELECNELDRKQADTAEPPALEESREMGLEQRLHRAHLLCLALETKSLLILWFHCWSPAPLLLLWGPHGLSCVP